MKIIYIFINYEYNTALKNIYIHNNQVLTYVPWNPLGHLWNAVSQNYTNQEICFRHFTTNHQEVKKINQTPSITILCAGDWVTFLEKMFCREKQSVAARALISPETSKDSSVAVASSTPLMMGMSDTYTYERDRRQSQQLITQTTLW